MYSNKRPRYEARNEPRNSSRMLPSSISTYSVAVLCEDGTSREIFLNVPVAYGNEDEMMKPFHFCIVKFTLKQRVGTGTTRFYQWDNIESTVSIIKHIAIHISLLCDH